MLVLHTGRKFLDSRHKLINLLINELGGDRPTIIKAQSVMNPLPELHTSNLRSCRIFHEVIERYTSVSTNPSRHVCERAINVFSEARKRYLARHLGIEKVISSDFDFFAKNVVLIKASKKVTCGEKKE